MLTGYSVLAQQVLASPAGGTPWGFYRGDWRNGQGGAAAAQGQLGIAGQRFPRAPPLSSLGGGWRFPQIIQGNGDRISQKIEAWAPSNPQCRRELEITSSFLLRSQDWLVPFSV